MKISRQLNLIIPLAVDDLDGNGTAGTIYIHSTPIARAVFDTHFEVLTATYNAIWERGFGYAGAPRAAFLQLRKTAKDMGREAQIEQEVIAEARRLTNVAIPGPNGYQQYPLDVASNRDLLTADDLDEIMGLVCFFTLEVSIHRRPMAEQMMKLVGGMWGSQTTALGFTEYLNSLPTATPAASTGADPEAWAARETPVEAAPEPSVTLRVSNLR